MGFCLGFGDTGGIIVDRPGWVRCPRLLCFPVNLFGSIIILVKVSHYDTENKVGMCHRRHPFGRLAEGQSDLLKCRGQHSR